MGPTKNDNDMFSVALAKPKLPWWLCSDLMSCLLKDGSVIKWIVSLDLKSELYLKLHTPGGTCWVKNSLLLIYIIINRSLKKLLNIGIICHMKKKKGASHFKCKILLSTFSEQT